MLRHRCDGTVGQHRDASRRQIRIHGRAVADYGPQCKSRRRAHEHRRVVRGLLGQRKPRPPISRARPLTRRKIRATPRRVRVGRLAPSPCWESAPMQRRARPPGSSMKLVATSPRTSKAVRDVLFANADWSSVGPSPTRPPSNAWPSPGRRCWAGATRGGEAHTQCDVFDARRSLEPSRKRPQTSGPRTVRRRPAGDYVAAERGAVATFAQDLAAWRD